MNTLSTKLLLFYLLVLASLNACENEADDYSISQIEECQLWCEKQNTEELKPEVCNEVCKMTPTVANNICKCNFVDCDDKLCEFFCASDGFSNYQCFFGKCNCT